jgi:hypothetical protein
MKGENWRSKMLGHWKDYASEDSMISGDAIPKRTVRGDFQDHDYRFRTRKRFKNYI